MNSLRQAIPLETTGGKRPVSNGASSGILKYKEMRNNKFKLESSFAPSGDQPLAISALVKGIKDGERYQTLLGVTGSGKTFTVANVINQIQ